MNAPFEAFETELNWQQLALLADTASYFEEAPKLLSLPSMTGEQIPVPLALVTLRQMMEAVSEEQPFEKKRFSLDWRSLSENSGELIVRLSSGKELTQVTELTQFSLL